MKKALSSSHSRLQKSSKKNKNQLFSFQDESLFIDTEVSSAKASFCVVCGGIEDEDLTLLCDAPGCENEAHMFCLTPVLLEIPEGD